MPDNAASRSLNLPEELTKTHSVLFFVYTELAAGSADQLTPHLPEHLAFLKDLRERGLLSLSGPFLTRDGKNSGAGMYVLSVDNISEAEQVAARDPMHKLGLRKSTVQPWAKDDN